MCVGAALNQSLCVLRVKDGQMTSSRLPDLITALEWKKGQVEGDSPTLLVGLVSGQLLLAAVLRISMNLTPEIHTAYLEPTLKGAEDVYDNVQCLALEALCHVQQAFHSLISTHTHIHHFCYGQSILCMAHIPSELQTHALQQGGCNTW